MVAMNLSTMTKMGSERVSLMLCVQRGLDIVGSEEKEMLLSRLKALGLGSEEIPVRIEYFVSLLRSIFGSSASLIEGEIEDSLRLMERMSLHPTGLIGAVKELEGRGSIQRGTNSIMAEGSDNP